MFFLHRLLFLARLDARSRAHAVALAMRHDLLPSEQPPQESSY